MTTYPHPTGSRTASGCEGCGGRGSSRPSGGCGCGCEPTETCALQCVDRPLFSAGMVLSDSDLTALVDWASNRFGLQRLIGGWGVVCGLDIRCDPHSAGRVVVDAGYAVGCCGEDIVLCEPQKVDLTGCCRVESPCGEPTRAEDDVVGKEGRPSGDPSREPSRDGVGACGDVVVDIVLEPTQTLTATGLVSRCGSGCGSGCGCGGGGSGGGSACHGCGGEHEQHGQHGHATQTDECGGQQVVSTRAREGGRAYAVKVSSPLADPITAAADRAREAYLGCHRIVEKYVEQGWKGGTSRDDIVGWLRRQDIDPPCDWWTRLCADLDRADGDLMTDAAVARALLELVADCRHRWLRRRCAGCEDDVVGLARVWLRRAGGRTGEETCVVTHVDSYPPYRRELGVAARPMPPGAEDLTSFVWQRWDQVCSRWRQLSPWTTAALEDVSGTGALLRVLDQTARLWWACDESALTPVVVDTACLGRRVIGFRPSDRDGLVFPAGDSMSVRALGVFPPPGPPGEAAGRVEAAADVTDADASITAAVETEGADDAPADAAATTADADAGGAILGEPLPAPTKSLFDPDDEDPPAAGDGDAVPVDQPAPPVARELEDLAGVGKATAARLRAKNIATIEELSLFDPYELAAALRNGGLARRIQEEARRVVREGP